MIEIDGYADVVRVGAGGIGDVYRARRVSTGSTVAIKVLRDVSDSSAAWRRTRRELTALVSLAGHAHVIGVLEVVDLPAGPALVMEYAEGGSVAELLGRREGALPIDQTVLIGRHAAAALAAAHEHGIIHRDLKPQNLLVDAYGQVKLCDFGIAALARSDDFRHRTSAWSMRYASPEDLDEAAELTAASDVYSLGATLLHLAHGAPPTLKERLARWAPPATDDGEQTALDAVIADCLAPDPAARPSATAVLERLEVLDWTLATRCRALPVVAREVVDDEPASHRPGATGAFDTGRDDTSAPTALRPDRPRFERAAPPATRRRRWPWVAGLLAMATGAGVVAASWWPSGRADLRAEPHVGVTSTTIERRSDATPPDAPDAPDARGVPTAPARDSAVEALAGSAHGTVPRPAGLPALDPDATVWPFGEVGSCLVQVNGLDELMPVDCGEPHDLQRFAVSELAADDPYRADDLRALTDVACRDEFTRFTGVEPGDSPLGIAVTRPSEASWSEGDRRFQCLLGAPGWHLVGDAERSGA